MMRSGERSLSVNGLDLYRILPVRIWKRRYYSLSKSLSDYYLGRVHIGMSYFWFIYLNLGISDAKLGRTWEKREGKEWWDESLSNFIVIIYTA